MTEMEEDTSPYNSVEMMQEPNSGGSSGSSPSNPLTSATDVPVRWYQRRWFRLLTLRVLLRLAMVGLFVSLIKTGIIPFGDWLRAYLGWIDSLPLPFALFVFAVCSIPFAAFTPGSYAPTVVAGATFPLYLSFPLSYLCINASAMLNVLVIRHGGCCQWMTARMRRRIEQRGGGGINLSTLDDLLLHHPVRTVILLRLPYLASGILNYAFSSSLTLSARHHFMGNCVGFLPGSFLFALLGEQARSLIEIILEGRTDATSIIVVVLVSVFVAVTVFGIVQLVRQRTARQAGQVVVVVVDRGAEEDKDEAAAALTMAPPLLSEH